MMKNHELILASGNPDKLMELRYFLRGLPLVVIPVLEVLPGWSIEETGITLEDNALLKARDVSEKTGRAAVADDTGLFVDVLGGAPGVFAARFSGADCSYRDNVCKLLRTILGEENRKATFRTVAAFVLPSSSPSPSSEEFCLTGEIKGVITEEPDGDAGFGYDPVFLPDELDRTFARCSSDEKNRISHRARAMMKLREKLVKYLD